MSYQSIDTLQKALGDSVFSHTQDSKKAAGRALGTMVEIISYYLLKEWGLNDSISIERGLAEYGNPSITHNVEFTLHPVLSIENINLDFENTITSTKINKILDLPTFYIRKSNNLLDKNYTLKNSCVIAESEREIVTAYLTDFFNKRAIIKICHQHIRPYAMFECKRVGVEEGNKKGPQTIEKAKQGAYVAQNTSSLQKIRNERGDRYGIIYENNLPIIMPYSDLLDKIINGENTNFLKDFTLSIGIVSNHGNWFTSDNQNKELKVLAQSYDWLLFLTDYGLSKFITDLLMNPIKEKYYSVQQSFLNSYKEGKKSNTFTKVKMNLEAHNALCQYFHENINEIESWFNVIAPVNRNIATLKNNLFILKNKNWRNII